MTGVRSPLRRSSGRSRGTPEGRRCREDKRGGSDGHGRRGLASVAVTGYSRRSQVERKAAGRIVVLDDRISAIIGIADSGAEDSPPPPETSAMKPGGLHSTRRGGPDDGARSRARMGRGSGRAGHHSASISNGRSRSRTLLVASTGTEYDVHAAKAIRCWTRRSTRAITTCRFSSLGRSRRLVHCPGWSRDDALPPAVDAASARISDCARGYPAPRRHGELGAAMRVRGSWRSRAANAVPIRRGVRQPERSGRSRNIKRIGEPHGPPRRVCATVLRKVVGGQGESTQARSADTER